MPTLLFAEATVDNAIKRLIRMNSVRVDSSASYRVVLETETWAAATATHTRLVDVPLDSRWTRRVRTQRTHGGWCTYVDVYSDMPSVEP